MLLGRCQLTQRMDYNTATPVVARGTTQGVVTLRETITPLFKRGLPNVQDKRPKSAFIYAHVQLVFPDPN